MSQRVNYFFMNFIFYFKLSQQLFALELAANDSH